MRTVVIIIGFLIVYVLLTQFVFPKLGLPGWGGSKPAPELKNKRDKKGSKRG